MLDNPFILEPYYSKEYFCDREEETALLYDMLRNRQDVTLISPRRYGKTGLIYRLFDEIKGSNEYDCYYVDIFSATSLDDFISLLSESIVNVLSKESLIERFMSKLGAIRPILTFDTTSGKYSLSYTLQTMEQKKHTLKSLFSFLESEERQVILAIDEFQQIREFEEERVEALLRTYIQPLHNVHFIYCGSKKHVMINMFSDGTSPFYESSECIFLDSIDKQAYTEFIRKMFAKGNISIDTDAINMILDWTFTHTYYVQSLCNRLYAMHETNIDCLTVNKAIYRLLKQRENAYLERRNLLTKGQWKFLKALAVEGTVMQPSSAAFLKKHSLGAASSALKTLKSLVDKELVLETATPDGNTYRVYNVFFLRWLATL